MLKDLLEDLPELWNLAAWFRAVFSTRDHPVLQFIRYALAGLAAMVANVGVFILLEATVFPVEADAEAVQLSFSDLFRMLEILREDVRVANFFRCNAYAFVGANIVAYVLNFLWVFESGRHSRTVEVLLFFGVSFASFVLGTLLASIAVNQGIHPYLAKGTDVITAVLVNYVCRKFLIFKG